MSDSGNPLETAIAVARAAAKLCKKVQAGIPTSMNKEDRSPVTLADYGSQAVILRAVQEKFPEHHVLAEEGAGHLQSNASAEHAEQLVALVTEAIQKEANFAEICSWINHSGSNSSWSWCIDPIDGTKGFLRGDQYAIAIGILRDGEPFAGVLACPNLPTQPESSGTQRGVLFAALRGEGAKWCELESNDWHTSKVSTLGLKEARVLGSVESSHGDPALVTGMMQAAGIEGGFVRFDSQAKYGILARGGAVKHASDVSIPIH
ncbi:MAG TPA: 3'(2'),5'-bisphosphate nucleotidase [Planctomycetes bacterium]|nr:3'(2'),5'-bisphosphate nucleotidase [Planctomycetota bacterium]